MSLAVVIPQFRLFLYTAVFFRGRLTCRRMRWFHDVVWMLQKNIIIVLVEHNRRANLGMETSVDCFPRVLWDVLGTLYAIATWREVKFGRNCTSTTSQP